MIGDWVYNKHHKKNIRLTHYDFFTHTHNDFGEQELAPFAKPTSGRDLEPIPLTPEILEKNGFTKSTPPSGIHAKCYELDNKKDKYNLTIADYNKYKRLLLNVDSEDSECFNIKCDYVHELQHALRLCKIEKEIEL